MVYYNRGMLEYYRDLQLMSVCIIFLLALRLINYLIIFKEIGIYIIILSSIIRQIGYFLLYFFMINVVIGLCYFILFQNIKDINDNEKFGTAF